MHIGQKMQAQKCQMLMLDRLCMADKSSRMRRQTSAGVVIQCMLRMALEILQTHD